MNGRTNRGTNERISRSFVHLEFARGKVIKIETIDDGDDDVTQSLP